MRLSVLLALFHENVAIQIFDSKLNLIYEGYSESIYDGIDDNGYNGYEGYEGCVFDNAVASILPGIVTKIYLW